MRIILINGWSASAALLGGITDSLKQNHEVIVLDHLYQNSSADIQAQLDSLLTGDTVLMGWSLGGMLAIRYLLASTSAVSAVKALVLLQATPCFMQKADWAAGVQGDAFDSLKNLVDEQKAIKLVRYFTGLMLAGSDDTSVERSNIKACYNESTLPDWMTLSAGLRVLKELDLRDALASLSIPFFGIYGENDVLVKPEVRHYLSDHCPHFKGISLPGMGHFPFGKHAGNVVQCIEDYLQTVITTSRADDSN